MDYAQALDDLRMADDEVPGLVINDEPLVRLFGPTIFRREGWSVLEDADAVAAHAVADAERLNLLVPDFDMLSVMGASLAEQLRAFDEEVPVLVTAGRSQARSQARSARSPRSRVA